MNIRLLAPLSILASAAILTSCNAATTTDEESNAGSLPTADLAAARVSAPSEEVQINEFYVDSDLGAALESSISFPTATSVSSARGSNAAARMSALPKVDSSLNTSTGWLTKTIDNGSGWTKTDSIKVVPADLTGPVGSIRATAAISVIQHRDASGKLLAQERTQLHVPGDTFFVAQGPANAPYSATIHRLDSRTGIEAKGLLVANAGADGKVFEDADNNVVSLSLVRLRNGDTLTAAHAKGLKDGSYIKGASSDTSVFVVSLVEHTLLGGRRQIRLIAVATPKDTAIVGLQGEHHWANGRHATLSLSNGHGDSVVRKGDTAVLVHHVTWPAGDSNGTAHTELRVDPGTGLGRADNRNLSLSGYRLFVRGPISKTDFSVVSPTGWKGDAKPVDGTFKWEATVRDGRKATLAGNFTTTGLTGTWTALDGTVTSFERK
ncbi:MAG: hypothetical protein IPK50_13075 [Fibrobacterota bacterium]|nr:MAG: hypothetical protein IPK50_13075 [Fibrobacterota bacterium]